MSLSIKGKKGIYYTRFSFNGKRYEKSTNTTNEAEALEFERNYKEQLKAESLKEVSRTIAKSVEVEESLLPHSEHSKLLKVQHELEMDMARAGLNKYREMYERTKKTGVSQGKPEQVYISKHVKQFGDAIQQWTTNLSRATTFARRLKELQALEPEAMAFITLKMSIDSMGKYGPRNKRPLSFVALSEMVGTAIKREHERRQFFSHSPSTAAYWKKAEQGLKSKNTKYRDTVLQAVHTKLELPSLGWSKREVIKIGGTLIRIMVESTGTWIMTNVPKYQGSKQTITAVLPTEELTKWLKHMHETLALNTPEKWPMVLPPLKWGGLYGGGYLESIYRGEEYKDNCLVSYRTKGSLDKMQFGQDFLNSINTIQEVPWKIEDMVLEALEWCWDKGGGSEWGDLPIRHLKDLKESMPKVPEMATDEEIRTIKIARNNIYNEYFNEMAKRTAVDKQILMARKFQKLAEQGIDKIYFPWYADWRGRLYPIVSFISPQGNQVSKGLIKFHEGKRLGKEGVKWFLIHGANCYAKGQDLTDTQGKAVDKLSMNERIKWVHRHHEELKRCGEDYKSELFWLSAEKPFPFLQFCIEYAQYCKYGENHISYLPCAWDGTCSGVQHMSLIMADIEGAKATSLTSQTWDEEPGDIYTATAEVATSLIEKDLDVKTVYKEGKEKNFYTNELALVWNGRIDRKFVKSNVMTLSYGSGEYGRRDQIRENTKDKLKGDTSLFSGIDVKDQWVYISYAADKVNQAVQITVSRAYELMKYLQTLGRMVSKEIPHITWVTDTGFTVVQDYPKYDSKTVETYYGGTRYKSSFREDKQGTANANKHAQGIVPNFIHSLDAEHLQRCVLQGDKLGISSWGMIHDSFATHACDSGKLHTIIREELIDMYAGRDRLKEFRDKLCAQVSDKLSAKIKEIPMPEKGSFDYEEIREATYAFS